MDVVMVCTGMRRIAGKHGFELVEVGVDSAADIPQRLQSLSGKVDAVFVIQSNVLQTSLPVIAATAQRIGVPAINTLDTPVRVERLHALVRSTREVDAQARPDLTATDTENWLPF